MIVRKIKSLNLVKKNTTPFVSISTLLFFLISFIAVSQSKCVFSYTGQVQTYTVPTTLCTNYITLKMWGAGGAAGYGATADGGGGGFSTALLPVTPGEVLTIMVGGGGASTTANSTIGPAAFGGGGKAGAHNAFLTSPEGGGGGMSAVWGSLGFVIAGGGGGADGACGGAGGGTSGLGPVCGTGGGAPENGGGGGGTSIAGGAGGTAGTGCNSGGVGGAYTGGDGANYGQGTFGGGGCSLGDGSGGGGGGGGYFGGGGGNESGAGGGGGSGYIPPGTGNSTIAGTGATPGNAADPDRGNAGTGGIYAGTSGVAGQPGLVILFCGINLPVTSTNNSCPGQCKGTATVVPCGGTAPYTYSWNTTPLQTTQNATGLCAGNYTLTVIDASGDTSTAAFAITQPPALTATLTVTAADTCGRNDGSVTINASGGTFPYTYSWFHLVGTSTATGHLSSGTYTVSVTDANGCTTPQTVTVPTVPGPTAQVAGNITITQGQSVTLSASGGGTYLWNNGVTGAFITISPTITTMYCVAVTDVNNCTDSACATVTIPCPGDLYVPDAFSPNADGYNDVLYVRILTGCLETLDFQVYDRWGNRVFESTDPDEGWDGKYKGKELAAAVFVYSAQAILINGISISKKGNISLIK